MRGKEMNLDAYHSNQGIDDEGLNWGICSRDGEDVHLRNI